MPGRRILLLVRAVVLALALFGAGNVILGQLGARDVNALWVRGTGFPAPLGEAAVVGLAAGLLLGRWGAWLARGAGLLLAFLAAVDATHYYRLLADGDITSARPLPAGLVVAALLVVWAILERPPREGASKEGTGLLVRTALLGAAATGLLFLHLLCFGATDYRRPADAAVVFGARVHEDGAASTALRDRILTACDLYDEGLVRFLVLSGGKSSEAPVSEPACMKRIALARGVPASALILDEQGRDTRATIENLRAIASEHGLARFLMVSHDYHLLRIQLASRRAGLEVFTVPARETAPWPGKHRAVLREGAAWLWYYLRDVDVNRTAHAGGSWPPPR